MHVFGKGPAPRERGLLPGRIPPPLKTHGYRGDVQRLKVLVVPGDYFSLQRHNVNKPAICSEDFKRCLLSEESTWPSQADTSARKRLLKSLRARQLMPSLRPSPLQCLEAAKDEFVASKDFSFPFPPPFCLRVRLSSDPFPAHIAVLCTWGVVCGSDHHSQP